MYANIAAPIQRALKRWGWAGLLCLGGCTALPQSPTRALLYDFGPGALTMPSAHAQPPLSAVVLAEVQAASQSDASTAVWYRLAYADAGQLRPYQLARWSLPPAQLFEQELRAALGQRHVVLRATDARTTTPATTVVLRVQLEEFSQVFSSPSESVGLVRLRATAAVPGPQGNQRLSQRLFMVQQPANSADAAGGTRALAQASAQAAQALAQWLQEVQP